MIPMRASTILSALLLAGGVYAARPQDSKPADSADSKKAAKQRTIKITGIDLTHKDSTGLGQARDVVLVDGDTVVHCDSAHWNMKSETAEGVGSLNMTDP